MQDREKTTSVRDQRMTITLEDANKLIAEATGKYNKLANELARLRADPSQPIIAHNRGWQGVDDLYDACEVLVAIEAAIDNVVEELRKAKLRHEIKWPSSPEKAQLAQAFLTNKMMVIAHSINIKVDSVPATPITQYDIAPS